MGDFNSEKNRAVWFDIPVVDLDRAIVFYAAVLDIEVSKEQFDGYSFGVLDHQDGNGGCLIENSKEVSSDRGILVYFNVDKRIKEAVGLVDKHGGSIISDIHAIGPHGYRAIVLDSEGNRIVLHSNIDA